MAQGGIGNQSPATLFQARLDTSIPLSNGLRLLPYIGNKVVVSGQMTLIPSGGLLVLNTDNLIDVTGADSGAPGVANTLYYVYVSNQKASFAPSSIRLSAIPPATVNGVKYLRPTGNALNWRFVGWVRLNATPLFEFSDTYAGIVNYYNRILRRLFTCPGYINDGSTGTWHPGAGGVWHPVNAGVGNLVRFIANGEDAVILFGSAESRGGGTDAWFGIGIDGTNGVQASAAITNQSINGYNAVVSQTLELTEGDHTAELSGEGDGGSIFTLFGPLWDSPASVFRTYLYASVMV